MTIRLVIAGAAGRMGQRIAELALRDPGFQLVGGLVESADSGKPIHQSSAKTTHDLSILASCDVVIDFTTPLATAALLDPVRKARKAYVIGTTGLSADFLRKVDQAGQEIPIVQSPNMSRGMNLLFKLSALAASTLASYDVEVIEAHHRLKEDSPSGSALKLGEYLAEALKRDLTTDAKHGRYGAKTQRTDREIGFHAVRGGDIVGDHTVLLAGPGERLELTHRAHSRDTFAAGALEAAKWVTTRKPGRYSMQDVLGL